jgi:hypothetical protein
MTNRSILTVILLSIFTCGIYQIYWMYVTTEELNANDPTEPLTNYILAIILSLVTCGIYGFIWNYKFYKKVDAVAMTDDCLLSYLLSLFVSPLIGMGIAQNSFNKLSA